MEQLLRELPDDPRKRYVAGLLIQAAKNAGTPISLSRSDSFPLLPGCSAEKVSFDYIRDRLNALAEGSHCIELSIPQSVLQKDEIPDSRDVDFGEARQEFTAHVDLTHPDVITIAVEIGHLTRRCS